MDPNEIKINYVIVESNTNKLKDKIEQAKVKVEEVEKHLDEIRNFEISISVGLS
jgi:hypothetical protein